jgi:alanine-glyoxylate transaminase/serine-glyoxylate transaminase/serine-pyruvate transaminase
VVHAETSTGVEHPLAELAAELRGRDTLLMADCVTALRGVLEEGLEARWERHARAAAHLRAGLEGRGLELLADAGCRLAPLTAVRVPPGVDGKQVQGRVLREHGIEIGGGLGPGAPPIWRIGLMGRNATVGTADRVLGALDAVLAQERDPAGAAA